MKNNKVNFAYITRYQRQLKEWSAPLNDWYCIEVTVIKEEVSSIDRWNTLR